jgi:hypothetical protein
MGSDNKSVQAQIKMKNQIKKLLVQIPIESLEPRSKRCSASHRHEIERLLRTMGLFLG